MSTRQGRIWVGIDAGEGHHWAVALDADGETLFSTKVINDEAQILALIETAREQADEIRWAVDISGPASTLLLACWSPTDRAWSTCWAARSTG